MNISELKTPAQFDEFCCKMSCENIQSMSTRDWNNLYERIEHLCVQEMRSYDALGFMAKHQDSFDKLYANYRCDKAYLQKVKALAIKAADNYVKNTKNVLKLYLDLEVEN